MRNRPIKLRAIYPLYPPIRLHSESHIEQYNSFIAQFQEFRRIPVQGSYFHDHEELSVRAVQCSASMQKKLFGRSKFGLRTKHLLEFSGLFKFPKSSKYFVSDHAGNVLPHSAKQLHAFWLDDLPEYLDLTIQTFFCAAIIAFPGAAYPTGNIWFLGKNEHRFSRHFVSPIHDAIEFLRQHSLHPLPSLDFWTVAKWVFSQGGMVANYSNTATARSLNYFTRLFVPEFREDELANTVWALAGIEALLVEGGRSSGGQLKEKLSALLGSPENSDWLLAMTDNLYSFRSKMVHGNRQLKSAFRRDDAEESQKRFDEEYNSELFAIGTLTVLLQHVIDAGGKPFRFKTVLDVS